MLGFVAFAADMWVNRTIHLSMGKTTFQLREGAKSSLDTRLRAVAHFRNDTPKSMTLFLEMLGEEVVIAPGQEIELLALPLDDLLPLTIDYVEGGIQVHPHKEFDPDWHVRFRGKLIRAGHPTILSEHM